MSYYTNLSAEKNWEIAQARLQGVPHRVNRRIFWQYLNERRASTNVDSSTLTSDADEFKRFGTWLKSKPARGCGRNGIVAYFGSTIGQAPGTRYKSFVILRAFYRWLHDLDSTETPPEFHRFRIKRPGKVTVKAEDLITPEEFRDMLGACRDTQEKFIIAGFYEAGPRATEFLVLDVDHVTKDEYGYILDLPDVDGLKTGKRRLRCITSAKYLEDWLDDHKRRDRPGTPLLYSMSNRNRFGRLGYQTLRDKVKRIARDAGIKRRIWLHLFRHTSATEAAKRGLDGQAMNMVYGWTDTSDTWAVYTHLSKQNADERLLKSYGIDVGGKAIPNGLKPLLCPVPSCTHANPPHRTNCIKCDAPLTPRGEAMLKRRREDEFKEFMAQALRDYHEGRGSASV